MQFTFRSSALLSIVLPAVLASPFPKPISQATGGGGDICANGNQAVCCSSADCADGHFADTCSTSFSYCCQSNPQQATGKFNIDITGCSLHTPRAVPTEVEDCDDPPTSGNSNNGNGNGSSSGTKNNGGLDVSIGSGDGHLISVSAGGKSIIQVRDDVFTTQAEDCEDGNEGSSGASHSGGSGSSTIATNGNQGGLDVSVGGGHLVSVSDGGKSIVQLRDVVTTQEDCDEDGNSTGASHSSSSSTTSTNGNNGGLDVSVGGDGHLITVSAGGKSIIQVRDVVTTEEDCDEDGNSTGASHSNSGSTTSTNGNSGGLAVSVGGGHLISVSAGGEPVIQLRDAVTTQGDCDEDGSSPGASHSSSGSSSITNGNHGSIGVSVGGDGHLITVSAGGEPVIQLRDAATTQDDCDEDGNPRRPVIPIVPVSIPKVISPPGGVVVPL